MWTEFTRPMPEPRFRLLCFPFAGGGALTYRPWVPALRPDGIDVWPIQIPGRETRFDEPSYEDLGALLSALFVGLEPCLESTPYALFGHSMGAVVALEFAYEVRRRGLPGPVRLFLSACRPPNRPDPDSPRYNLPKDRFVEELRKFDETSPLLSMPEFHEVFLPKLRSDFALAEKHEFCAEPPLDCPLSVLGGTDDKAVTADLFEGWADYTRSGFEIRLLRGPHMFLEPARDRVIHLIRQRLDHTP